VGFGREVTMKTQQMIETLVTTNDAGRYFEMFKPVTASLPSAP